MNYEILLLADQLAFYRASQIPNWRASFWVKHCAEQNSSQMPGVCPPPRGGAGCFGIEWYIIIIIIIIIKYKEKSLDIPNLI